MQVAIESAHLSFEQLTDRDCRDIASFCCDKGLSVSLHCPDHVTSLFTTSPHLVEGIFGYYDALFAFAESIGSRLITVHIGEAPSFGTDTTPRVRTPEQDVPIYMEAVDRNLRRLVSLAADRFVLCTENYHMDPRLFDIVQPYVENGDLWLCWDLAKTYDSRINLNLAIHDYFRHNIDFVRQVHLHDLRDGHSHRVIGSGDLDFLQFLPDLSKANVMDFCIEVRPREQALESMANLRSLIEREGRE